MRVFSLALVSMLTLTCVPAHAALVWSETNERGTPVTRWAMGANLNEAYAAAKVAAGQPLNVISTCRNSGYFAFVGSMGQTQRGLSCGFETAEAALQEARAECELEGGRCDLEKIGHDTSVAIASNASESGVPALMSGIISDSTPGNLSHANLKPAE